MRYNPVLLAATAGAMLAGLSADVFLFKGAVNEASLVFLGGWPPNLIRLALVALTSAVLVLAVAQARRTLLEGIREMQRRARLTHYLPPRVADWLAEVGADTVRAGSNHHAAVMFVDLRGFTQRTEESDPLALGAFLTEYRALVSAVVEAHDGIIDKFIGDGIMAVFGVPQPSSAAAENAVAAAVQTLHRLDEWNASLARRSIEPTRFGIGVHWGNLFAGMRLTDIA